MSIRNLARFICIIVATGISYGSSVQAQWDPYAGVVPSLTDGALVYTSSGGDGSDIVDNDDNTSWQTGSPLPTAFFGRPDLNILLNEYFKGQCSNSGGVSCINAIDQNLNSKVDFSVSVNHAWLKFDFDSITTLRTISLKAVTNDPAFIYGYSVNGDSTLIGVFESTDNFSIKRFSTVLDSIVAIKLICESSFSVFEIGAMSGYPVEYAIVDMGQLNKVGYIETRHWANGGAVTTRILLSTDSLSWTLVGIVNPDALFRQTTRLPEPLVARYIKVEHWLEQTDFAKAHIWEVDAFDEFGPYGPMTTPVQRTKNVAEIVGINGLWGWGYGIYSNSLASGEGPTRFNKIASHARSYHNHHWDVKDPDDVPDFSKMDSVPSSLALWWLDWDREYQAWVDAGLKVQVTLKFNQSISPMSKWDDPFTAAFKYGYAFARHFGPTHGNNLVDAFEIGNEPWDYPASFYKEVLRGMALGAKVADPHFFVMPCALQAAFPQKEYSSGGNFMGARLPEQVAPYIDAINVHHYSYTFNDAGTRIAVHPEHPESQMRGVLNDIRFRDINLPGKEVHLSEWGWDSDGAGENCQFGECVSEYEQAIYAVRGAMMFIRLGVDRLSWYFFGNESSGGLYSRSGLVGHSSTNFAEKKSFKSFQALIDILGDRYFLDTLQENGQAWIYLFGDSAGNPTHLAAWRPISGTDTSTVEVELPISYAPETAWKIQGNTVTGDAACLPDYEGGLMKLRVSAVPLIIKLSPFAGGTITWNGDTDNNWHTESNWSPNQVPGSLDEVIIPSGKVKYPAFYNANPEAGSLKIDAGAYITLKPGFDLLVGRTINLNEGAIFVSGSAGATPDIKFGGNWYNSGMFAPGAGKVLTNGKRSQCIYGKNIFRNLEINSGGELHLIDTTTVTGILSVKSGSEVHTNDLLILESGASVMHGEDTPHEQEGVVSGLATIKRVGSSNRLSYNYWSSPVEEESVNVLGRGAYYYDPSLAPDTTAYGLRRGWVLASGVMDQARGYAVQGAGLVSFFGELSHAPVEKPIITEIKKNVGTANNVPYNLIGNPFPSALDARIFMDINGPTGAGMITGAIYLWDDDGSDGSNWNAGQDYTTWTGAGAVTGYNNNKLFNGYIATGQSFFVEKINDGADNVVYNNTMRATKNNVFFKQAPIDRLWLNVINPDSNYNETLIAFMPDASDGIDLKYDAKKMKGNPNLALYSRINDRHYAIQALAPLTVDKVVPLGLHTAKTGTHIMDLKLVENLDETVVILLEDRELGVFHNLRIEPYSFVAQTANYNERFYLHFNPHTVITVKHQSCEGFPGEILLEQDGSVHWNLTLTHDQSNAIAIKDYNFNRYKSITGLAAGNYTLQLTDTFGYTVLKTVAIGAKEAVVADFHCEKNVFSINEPVYFQNLTSGAEEYIWNFGNGFYAETRQPVHQYPIPGVYEVILKAFNSECEDSISKTIRAEKFPATGGYFEDNTGVSIYGSVERIYVRFDTKQVAQAQILAYDVIGRQIIHKTVESIGLYSFPVNHPGNIFLVKVVLNKDVISSKVLIKR